MKSIFIDKDLKPTDADLKKALGDTFGTWQQLVAFTKEMYPKAHEEWNFSSAKYGWSFRISDNKRVLLYLLPRDRFFKAAFVFGQKATDVIMQSHVHTDIKAEIQNARVYAEGRGIRIEIRDNFILEDIKKLIAIKVSN